MPVEYVSAATIAKDPETVTSAEPVEREATLPELAEFTPSTSPLKPEYSQTQAAKNWLLPSLTSIVNEADASEPTIPFQIAHNPTKEVVPTWSRTDDHVTPVWVILLILVTLYEPKAKMRMFPLVGAVSIEKVRVALSPFDVPVLYCTLVIAMFCVASL